jgi:hypothetical protein
MFALSRTSRLLAIVGLLLTSIGAGRVPHGGTVDPAVSLAGCIISLMAGFSANPPRCGLVHRALRSGLIVLGILVLWAGTIAAATTVAGIYYARSHQTPFSASAEIVMATICAVVAPCCLTFKARAWQGWNRQELGLAWGYWLAWRIWCCFAFQCLAGLDHPGGRYNGQSRFNSRHGSSRQCQQSESRTPDVSPR